MVTVFVDIIASGMLIPILVTIFYEPGGIFFGTYSEFLTNWFYGLLMALYPIAQFFGSPLLGSLSDKYGRKPVLLLSIFGTFLSYILLAIGIMRGNLELMFFARALDGFTGGNIVVAYSAVADISSKEEKTAAFGKIGAVFGFGFIIGPFLGGIFGDPQVLSWFGPSVPFWIASVLAFINVVLVWANLLETAKLRDKLDINIFSGFSQVKKGLSLKKFRGVLIVSFMMMFGFTFFTQFFQVNLIDRFSISSKDIGLLFGLIGLCIAFTQGLLVPRLAKKYIPIDLVIVALICLSVSILVSLITPDFMWTLIAAPLIPVTYGIASPNIAGIISNRAKDDEQGEIMGINQSVQALGFAVPPLVGGLLLNLNSYIPLLVASAIVFVAGIIAYSYKVEE